MTVIEKITAQQGNEGTDVWVAGEQLKEIAEDPACAELLDKDLDNEKMAIEIAVEGIRTFAHKNKIGNFGYVPPQKAEEILREFYGLPPREENSENKPEPEEREINLADFL